MNTLALFTHVLSFAAPALAVAFLVALCGRWLLPGSAPQRAWWRLFAINFVAGLVLLGAGLWLFGRDGKMLTYAALVLGVATTQWLAGRAWRP